MKNAFYKNKIPARVQADSARVPEVGELVEVRMRQWLVSGVKPSCPEDDPLREQDLVTLESIEEDAEGEQLKVVWQIEPGARILERAGLPEVDGHDTSEEQQAFLNAVEWGISTNIDRGNLLSPFRSGIAIEDYQLDPLVRAINMARVNLLIADDTGLGKTIEAGLVVQELLIRHRARSVLIVAPAANLTNWQREMHEKFGLDFHIIDTDFLRTFRRERGVQANPWTSFPYLIASMDWIKQGEGFRLLKDALPVEVTYPRKFDILIVDEAHNVAPSGSARGDYAKGSLRTRAIGRIAPHFTHHLFLSATPHNGYTNSFCSLLELLDNQRFSRTIKPSETQLDQVMVRRLKRDIFDKDGQRVFPTRKLLPLEIAYTDEERAIHQCLKSFMDLRMKHDASFGTGFVMMLLKKRLFSSPAAFARTLEKYCQSLERGPQKKVEKRDEDSLFAAIRRAKEDAADEAEVEEAEDEAIEKHGALTAALSDEEKKLLEQLRSWAQRNEGREDSKAAAILAWLDAHLKDAEGHFNEERVILFTEFMDTHTWLKTILAHHGYGGNYLLELHGSLKREERDEVIDAFQTKVGPSSPARILLATDSASEGINLHNYCHYLIHVEIPWNPNVMEQRNGRIDRHGQRAKEVYIWHPVGAGFKADEAQKVPPGDIVGDGEYLLRAAMKVEAIREDLGSVGSVLSEQIQSAMINHTSRLDADVQKARRERAQKMLAIEKNYKARIALLHKKLDESKEEGHWSAKNIKSAVDVALRLAGKPALMPVDLPGARAGSAWKVPNFEDSWKAALVGLTHPHTHEVRPVTFDPEVARGRDDVVLAHLNHALVRLSLRLLREEVWKASGKQSLHRVTVRKCPGLTEAMVITHARLLLVGGDHLRLQEELIYAGGYLRANSYRREETLGNLQKYMDSSRPYDDVPEAVFEILKTRFNHSFEDVRKAYEGRAAERAKSLRGALEKRRATEIANVDALLTELENGIKKELKEAGEGKIFQMSFEGFDDEAKQEVKRDLDALRARLAQIPEERRKEKAILEQHYSDMKDLTFPVAILFLVPETASWGCRA